MPDSVVGPMKFKPVFLVLETQHAGDACAGRDIN